jgi:CHAT domain
MASPETTPAPLRHVPDLELRIQRKGTDGTLVFEVFAPQDPERINLGPVRSRSLGLAPEKYLYHLFTDIDNLPLKTDEDRREAEIKLTNKGLAIWDLFPREVQKLLWNRRLRPLSLLLQSDEEFIPWEMAKLSGREENGPLTFGPFLCEAFAVTRWVLDIGFKPRLPLGRLALVIPSGSQLPHAAKERGAISALFRDHGRQSHEVPPKLQPVRDALASGEYDAWHFAGHGANASKGGDDADRWHIELDENTRFDPEELRSQTALETARPLVFFNGCYTGRSGLTLTGAGGWSQRFLAAGVSAFLGSCWAITDSKALELAQAFYSNLFKGLPIGEAVRQARLQLHKSYPGDPTWLAYTVFADPMATCGAPETEAGRRERETPPKPPQITIPLRHWQPDLDPPGALLRAQFGVVPFHRREVELDDLQKWCHASPSVGVRLYTGPGGIGKTRLALEATLRLRDEGWWTGFATKEGLRSPERTWQALARPDGNLLLVVDYAELNRPFLSHITREMYHNKRGRVRLILLARAALDWWEQLKNEPDGVGNLLSSPATSQHFLKPLADTEADRGHSYTVAAQAFSKYLQGNQPGSPPDDLDVDHFQRALFLHMQALIDLEGKVTAKGQDGILDRILARERQYWTERAVDRRISPEIVPGIGRALAAITLGGGVQKEPEALDVIRRLRFFERQPAAVLVAVARLLHEAYPGERWIEPLQPDLLGEHLVHRELENGADELFDLVFGPKSEESASAPDTMSS